MRDPAYRFAGAIVPGLLWLWLFFHLHDEWTLNAQYNYGWAVPFLAALIFFLRWLDRPATRPGRAPVAFALGSVLLVLLFPLRLIEEANPDWRLLSWALALIVVGYSLVALWRFGGRAWTWHFAFPICFPLVAVPWPVRFENVVIRELTRAVAAAAVEVAGWLGIGAYQLGNVIQLVNGFVGVDQACSGVKTLQAAIMVALFLGEILRLPFRRRLVLTLLGSGWVFFCNIVRASALVMIAARRGIPALEHWHDLIGGAVLVLGMGGLVGFAFGLKGGTRSAPQPPAKFHPPTVSVTETGVALAWLALVFASTEVWYRAHERHLVQRPAWDAQWPRAGGAKPVAISETTAAILRYNTASSAAWTGAAGEEWWGFFARWESNRAALQLVRSHSPEICLPAIGRTFVQKLPVIEIAEGALHLRFRAYEFLQNDRPLFVFVCVQEDKTSLADAGAGGRTEWNASGRLQAAWNGERNLGQRLLELAVIGLADYAAAEEALRQAAHDVARASAIKD